MRQTVSVLFITRNNLISKMLIKTECVWIFLIYIYQKNMQLINAAEYFMLDSEAESLPEELLTLPGYSVEVEYDDVDSLPDDIDSELGQYELVMMRVSLLDDSSKVCKTVAIERIMQRR